MMFGNMYDFGKAADSEGEVARMQRERRWATRGCGVVVVYSMERRRCIGGNGPYGLRTQLHLAWSHGLCVRIFLGG